MKRQPLTPFLVGLLTTALLLMLALPPALAMPPRPNPYDELGQRVAAGPGLEKLASGLVPGPGVDGRYTGKSAPRSGVAKLPVLLVQYPGQSGQVPQMAFSNMLFSVRTYPNGSMRDYYVEQNGLSITGQVWSWVTVPMAKANYVNGFGGMLNSYPYNSQGLVRDAALAADLLGVDFSQYDNDGPDGLPNSGDDDGVVDCLIVVVAGYGAESYSPANPQQEIWSHFWYLSAGNGPGPLILDGVRIDPYTIQSELRNTSGAQIRDIGVFCHEYGHAMGLPDEWSTCPASQTANFGAWNGLGVYDLMGYGGWGANGNNPDRPFHLSAFSKALLGWVILKPVTIDQIGAQIRQVETMSDVYWVSPIPWFWVGGILARIPPPNWDLHPFVGEGWLVENRQQVGFDAGLPGSGLLVYHVESSVAWNDYDGDGWDNYLDNAVEWSERHPLVRLECADQTGADHALNNDHLASQTNFGDATDFFRQGNNTTFDNISRPSSARYTPLTAQPPFAMRNVSASGPVMTMDLLVGMPGGPGHDIWLKDCPNDDGSTPSYFNCPGGPGSGDVYSSPDIWVDNNRDGFADSPVRGAWNLLFAKFRNRGTGPVPYAKVWMYDLTSLGSAPPLASPPPPRNPLWRSSMCCSTTVLAFMPGDSVTTMTSWWVPTVNPYPPGVAVCVETPTDYLGTGGGDVATHNNFSICGEYAIYSKAGTPVKAGGGAVAGLKEDPPALPIEQVVPINNPFEEERLITVELLTESPPEWAVTLLGPGGVPIVSPWTTTLAALELVELTLIVDPGPGAFHGQTGRAWIREYQAELFPAPEGLLGSRTLPLGVDVRPTQPVTRLFARLIDRQPCLPPAVEVQLSWDPVTLDIAGDPESPACYAIYRQALPGLPLDPTTLVARVAYDGNPETEMWEWTDPEQPVNLETAPPWYAVVAVDKAGNESAPSEFVPATAVNDGRPVALRLAIEPNRPNPFNPRTLIRYTVPRDGRVHLAIYDVRGRLVIDLVDAIQTAGEKSAVWDGRDGAGRGVAAGSYFARIEAAGEAATRKMSLVR